MVFVICIDWFVFFGFYRCLFVCDSCICIGWLIVCDSSSVLLYMLFVLLWL